MEPCSARTPINRSLPVLQHPDFVDINVDVFATPFQTLQCDFFGCLLSPLCHLFGVQKSGEDALGLLLLFSPLFQLTLERLEFCVVLKFIAIWLIFLNLLRLSLWLHLIHLEESAIADSSLDALHSDLSEFVETLKKDRVLLEFLAYASPALIDTYRGLQVQLPQNIVDELLAAVLVIVYIILTFNLVSPPPQLKLNCFFLGREVV